MKVNKGFTLIELLVVISIIAVISTAIFATMNQAREKSQIVNIANQLREIEKAFILWADDENRATWWTETEAGAGLDPPTIPEIVQNSSLGFSTFLKVGPTPPIGTDYYYDNDVDLFVCGGSNPQHGVNITLNGSTENVTLELDEIFDGGDGNDCGKITWDPPNSSFDFFYKLSNDDTF